MVNIKIEGISYAVQEGLTILDGNGNGKGLIAIRQMKWDHQTFRAKYIIQPTQTYFDILYSV